MPTSLSPERLRLNLQDDNQHQLQRDRDIPDKRSGAQSRVTSSQNINSHCVRVEGAVFYCWWHPHSADRAEKQRPCPVLTEPSQHIQRHQSRLSPIPCRWWSILQDTSVTLARVIIFLILTQLYWSSPERNSTPCSFMGPFKQSKNDLSLP